MSPTYFNGITNPYTQNYQQPYQQNQYAYQQPSYSQNANGIIWVDNEEMAKSYLVAPNTTVELWDKNSQTIYLKSADGSGMPTLRILDYVDRTEKQKNTDNKEFVTRDEFDKFVEKMEKKFNTTSTKKGAKKDE